MLQTTLQNVDKFVTMRQMRATRHISWIKAARKDFEEFPGDVQSDMLDALTTLKIAKDIWVIHAFQKKSKKGIETPQMEVDLIRHRIKRLKEALK
jgi:phage-related protein